MERMRTDSALKALAASVLGCYQLLKTPYLLDPLDLPSLLLIEILSQCACGLSQSLSCCPEASAEL